MFELANKKDFEAAAKLRDRINDLVSISHKIDVAQDTDEHKFRRVKDANKALALAELLEIVGVDNLEIKPNFKMECYDISNISGTNAVGSMVVFVNGQPANRLYRKFKIRGKNTPNDFAMLQEVFGRRFGRFAEPAQSELLLNETVETKAAKKTKAPKKDASFDIVPDLIIVDGGKGQLSSVYKVLTSLKVEIPVIGLAKRFEEIYAVKEDADGELAFIRKTLPMGSQARFLMQRIRDEAHRFGITFHRELRLKAQKFSVLNEIPGVGVTIGSRLLKAFGSVEGIRKASEAELAQVVRNKKTIQKIRAVLGA
jgi:excinuclease ABC subunit C